MIQLDEYFSIGLKPPTSFQILLLSPHFARCCRQFLWTAGTKMITRLAAFLGGLRRVRCNFNMTVLFFEGHILHKILQELIVNPHYLQVLYRFQVIFQILSINRRMMGLHSSSASRWSFWNCVSCVYHCFILVI